MGKLKDFVDDVFGPTPKTFTDIPHNEQNDDVFNSENSPPQNHMEDDSVNPEGLDPFYGTHTQTVEEVTGREAEVAHKDYKRGMTKLASEPFLPTRELPSDDWAPRQFTLSDENPILLDGRDKDRLRMTIINPSTETVFLAKDQPPAGGSLNSIPLPTNSSLTLSTRDQVWAICPTAASGTPVTFGVFVEK